MSVITPSSDLYLLHAPLEADMNHQLNFSDAQAQFNYFSGLSNDYFADNFTYIRKDGRLTVDACMDDIITCNYLIYRNTAFGDKWFYAFITRMEFASPNSTHIYFKTDVWQTWQFDINIRKCFVEREHVNDDTIGLHTIDEGLGTGEYIINSVTNKTICAPDTNGGWIALATTELPTTSGGASIKPTSINSRMYNGIIQGAFIMLFEYNTTGINSLSNVIDWFIGYGKKDAIVSLYALPKNIYPSTSMISQSYSDPFSADIYWLSSQTGATDMGDTTITRNTTLNGYTPKNNKLFTYPFNYLMCTNNNGVNNIYNYEDFTNPNSVTFHYNGVVCEGSSVKCYPVNYKKNTTNYSGYAFGTDMGNTPSFSWLSDFYLNWQAQNSVKGGIHTAQGVVNSIMNVPEGSPSPSNAMTYFGNIAQGALEHLGASVDIVKNMMGMHQASVTPDQVSGESTGDLNFSIGRCGFTFYQMSIRSEVAQVIDEYFSMFGYKVNSTKVPNLTGRTNWNYVKLHDANILGDIPQADMQGIKSMFEKGVTIWHNPNTFMDYTQSNNIV